MLILCGSLITTDMNDDGQSFHRKCSAEQTTDGRSITTVSSAVFHYNSTL